MKKILFLLFLTASPAFSQTSFTGKPMYNILTKRAGIPLGTVTVELYPNIAPNHVINFDSLVNTAFYDSTAFHRVIPGFMIQGGDPNSRSGPISTWGYGAVGQPTVNAEFSVARHLRGTLSAARGSNINSATSQFFICVAPASWLNGQYSVYGHVTSGMDIVDTIVNSPRDANDNPFQKIEMFVSYIGSNDSVPFAPTHIQPLDNTMGIGTSTLLKWNPVSDAVIYRLEVSTDSLFSTFFKSIDLATTSNTVSSLVNATTYYWRVRVNNGGHFSSYSPFWRFNTNGVGLAEIDAENNILVYPNPGKGLVSFDNLEIGAIFSVYDVFGKEILSSICNNKQLQLDLGESPRGLYYYSVKGKQNFRGKFILQ